MGSIDKHIFRTTLASIAPDLDGRDSGSQKDAERTCYSSMFPAISTIVASIGFSGRTISVFAPMAAIGQTSARRFRCSKRVTAWA
jgi:hypothetical protein